MAFADNKPRTILAGALPCKVALAGTVHVGDLITYNSGWKQAAANTATSVLVAGESGVSGEEITAFAAAVIEGVSGATAGNLIISQNSGAYAEGAAGQRVGISLSATTIYVGPALLPVTIGG